MLTGYSQQGTAGVSDPTKPSNNIKNNGNDNSKTTSLLSDIAIANDVGNIVGNKILNDDFNNNEVLSENDVGTLLTPSEDCCGIANSCADFSDMIGRSAW